MDPINTPDPGQEIARETATSIEIIVLVAIFTIMSICAATIMMLDAPRHLIRTLTARRIPQQSAG